MTIFGLLLLTTIIDSQVNGLTWIPHKPTGVTDLGGDISLRWTYTLTRDEQQLASIYSLIIIEKERYLHSDDWLTLVVKLPELGFSKAISYTDKVRLIDGEGVGLVFYNVTDREETRYRCTFISGFSSPRSIIAPDITGKPLQARIIGASFSSGRIDVYYNGYWGTICNNKWDIRAASVACRMMGFHGAKKATCVGACAQGTGPVWLSELVCNGNEKSLDECSHDGWGDNACTHSMDAGLECYTTQPTTASTTTRPTTAPITTAVRLRGRNSSDFGRIEVYHDGQWGTVCDDQWDNNDAIVVCRMLGYNKVNSTGTVDTSMIGQGRIHMDGVECFGNETSIKDCKFNGWKITDCGHKEDVWVRCSNISTAAPFSTQLPTTLPHTTTATPLPEVRLVGFNRSDVGRLEVSHNGTWGTVCDDKWDNNDALVVCRMLGFQIVKQTGTVIDSLKGSGVIWMDEVKCSGTERALKDCPFDGWGKTDCKHDEDVLLWCANPPTVAPTTTAATTSAPTTTANAPTTTTPTTTAPTTTPVRPTPEVRLVGFNRSDVGRLEVSHNGTWGTVCDDKWDNNDALVVCRMLGFQIVKRTGTVIDSLKGSGIIWMDEVKCSGTERALKDCPFDGWGKTDCKHDEDVLLWCANPPTVAPTTVAPTPVRLVGVNRLDFGRLEVYHNGTWGTVCDDRWDSKNGLVVCRMLGFPYLKQTAAVVPALQGSGVIWMDEVKCNGTERSLKECPFDGWGKTDCKHDEDVGVWCANLPDVKLRLAGTRYSHVGRLEVYHNGVWGSVCDDGWSKKNAEVACKQLGYPHVWSTGNIGRRLSPGPSKIWLDDVVCEGNETTIAKCRHRGWGSHNCNHLQDVGIICGNTSNSTDGQPSLSSVIQIRISGKTSSFGRLEVFYNGTWGTVCSDHWDINAGKVACGMLGYPYVWFSGNIGSTLPGAGTIWLDDVRCFGNETSILDCSHKPLGVHDCNHNGDAGIWCGATATRPPPTTIPTTPPPPSIPLRLAGSNSSTKGRVEIFHNEYWGTICDDGWDLNDAHVVCRMLGLPGATNAVVKAGFGSGSVSKIWLDNVQCSGSESTLALCKHDPWGQHDCSHSEDAGVVCQRVPVDNKAAGCNFDNGYCHWQQSASDNFDWTRRTGATPSVETGPQTDHTSGKGHYIFIETSDCKAGQVASLRSPLLGSKSAYCLVFYYQMYGATIDTLRVKAGKNTLWKLSGQHGQTWYKASVPLNFSSPFDISIEAVCAADYRGDIAIDDVQLLNDTQCSHYAESAVPSKIEFISNSVTVTSGSQVDLSCSASGFPVPLVKWIHNNQIVVQRPAQLNYTINNITVNQGGQYFCVATNKYGTVTKSLVVYLLHKPLNTTTRFNVSFNVASIGHSVSVLCQAQANPSAICELFHRGNRLNMVSNSYVIQDFKSSDQGVYNCSCYNNFGRDYGHSTLTVYERPSIQVIHPTSQNISETDPISLFCNATGNPPPTVTWNKVSDSRVFSPGKTLHISRSTAFLDEGIYTCTADNGKYKAQANATVSIIYRVPRISSIPQNVSVSEDGSLDVTLYCNASAVPTPNITWYRQGSSTPMAYGQTLLLKATKSVSGIYECVATNGIGNAARAQAFVQIMYKPHSVSLKTPLVNGVVLGNHPFTITCTSLANPAADRYDFYFNGRHVVRSSSGVFTIASAKAADQGTYTCVSTNVVGQGVNNASLSIVIYGPLEIDTRPSNTTVNEGVSVTLYCNATSNPPAVIKWKKVDDPLVSFPDGRTLLLTNVQIKNAGLYECEARNGIANPVTARARVTVLHKPYKTKIVTSTGSNSIRVNESLTLLCTAVANPPASVYKFFHNGAVLGETSSGMYNISRVTQTGNGTYSCVAENALGKSSPGTITLKFLECGRPMFGSSIHSQIVSGVTSQHGAWPWQVQMGYKKDSLVLRHICGGSIIDKLWIVTAAHCVAVQQGLVFVAAKPEELNISLGEQFLFKADGTEQNVPVEKVIIHPNYGNLDYDIALIKLKQPIQFNSYVSPVCLPEFDFPSGTTCYVTGWGRTSRNSAISSVLQEAAIPLMLKSKCIDEYKNVKAVTPRMRCAGIIGTARGTCKGDSGGPLVCSQRGQWFLMGATSWSSGGCADSGYPGVYADMLYFKSWILNTTRISV